jgi:hypothetical protein
VTLTKPIPEATLALVILAATLPGAEAAAVVLERFGFDILDSFDIPSLDPSALALLVRMDQAVVPEQRWKVLVLTDVRPRPPGWRKAAFSRPVDNDRLYHMPQVQQFLIGPHSPANLEGPFLWTADSNAAYALLARFRPHMVGPVRKELERRQPLMHPPFTVLEELGIFDHCARVCLVSDGGERAVCKIYRPGRERYMHNSLIASERLAHIPEVVRVIQRGANWLLYPYLDSCMTLADYAARRRSGLLPLDMVTRLFGIVREIHHAGIAHLDFHPWHVLIDRAGGLHIIDFDRIHRYGSIPSMQESVMLTGYDDITAYEGPPGKWSYENAWLPITGMPLSVLLTGNRAERHASRAYYATRRLAARAMNGARNRMRISVIVISQIAPS